MEELATVNQKFQSRKRKQFLKNGVCIESPDTVFFSYDTKIGNEVVIQPNVYFGPAVTIKNKVTIRSFSYLDHVKINDHVTIGPFARIRDDVEIEQNTKIGNFVEIKKSKVKKDVKISHLSYIGDAIINKDTNIGAGAITCNYDGKKKNRTIIGENCFIGSNSSLVAPLNIKKGSIVGAGTVVNTDIPNETVVYRKSELIKKEKKK
ncbi:MAG: DapH/DapD/GlmU-related protein [Alphaproteobacteria bacterium]